MLKESAFQAICPQIQQKTQTNHQKTICSDDYRMIKKTVQITEFCSYFHAFKRRKKDTKIELLYPHNVKFLLRLIR